MLHVEITPPGIYLEEDTLPVVFLQNQFTVFPDLVLEQGGVPPSNQ
ncbi:hypothetical protein Tph_c02950 [Thermacetogenium phaeum DSM 12270]|uniref:Uncharacterized protein n=1 Tax=Thermacetogenium phaeum (strain ATCC BAA-254 / DSM 26808 / PB) TaxID=1089553 RepID=K4LEM1_THEPS|nr:hypothetical protein Tph_c02950 [Thermacetogenium phaeum DSM 12270]